MGERAQNPLVEQFRKGAVPRDLRLMAAQGLLPLKPEDLVDLLHHLVGDPDPAIAEEAGRSLLARPVEEMLPILKDRETPAPVLSWAVAHRQETALREAVLQNTGLPDESVEALAPTLPESLAELVVINQVRLLRRTSLLVALESNPNLSNDQKRRLRELRETFRIGDAVEQLPPAPVPDAIDEPPPADVAPAEPAPEAEERADESPVLTEEEALARYLAEDERQSEEKVSALQRVYRLNTAEKVVTALKGSREERAILVRDPNRIVSTAVLGSPRLTDPEVEAFAAMKNISDEILRQIGTNREWTKRYGVVSSLVRNPRTPLAISLGMVSRLTPRDLKSISVDRNVPEVIRKQAQRFVRGAQEAGGGKH